MRKPCSYRLALYVFGIKRDSKPCFSEQSLYNEIKESYQQRQCRSQILIVASHQSNVLYIRYNNNSVCMCVCVCVCKTPLSFLFQELVLLFWGFFFFFAIILFTFLLLRKFSKRNCFVFYCNF
uniref:Uncharacterized protein n=1 Tax=Octopus bimaculoides TaxID=37653 RepID=A0A0L8FXE2_OCTBM